MKKLDIFETIKEGLSLALVNYLSIICTVILYVITLWIPYLNVGTTIAMASLPAEMLKGDVINPLFIFDGKYRRNMGEFLILVSLMLGAIGTGMLFGVIPAFVISYAWYIALILFVDKDRPALESLRESNQLTYGNKARIFWIEFILAAIIILACALVSALCALSDLTWIKVCGGILIAVIAIFAVPAVLGAQAVIYKKLTEPEKEEEI